MADQLIAVLRADEVSWTARRRLPWNSARRAVTRLPPVTSVGYLRIEAERGHDAGPYLRAIGRHRPRRPRRKAIAGKTRHDDGECLFGPLARPLRLCEPVGDLEELKKRARPAVGDKNREGFRRRSPLQDDVNDGAIDIEQSLLERVDLALPHAPVEMVYLIVPQSRRVIERCAGQPVRSARWLGKRVRRKR